MTTNATEDAPLSVEEMRDVALDLDPGDFSRCVATAACLERATNWILSHERDAGKAPIPALETVGEALADPVESPAHYTQGGVECIDAIKAQLSPAEYRGFLRGQVAKYGWRLGLKGAALEDAQKAHWYLTRLVRELERHQKQEPVAAVRLDDGSPVVAVSPAGLEVMAFGVEDLDERGIPRWIK